MEDTERKEQGVGFNEEDEAVAELEETLKILENARQILLVSALISAVAVACMVIGFLAR